MLPELALRFLHAEAALLYNCLPSTVQQELKDRKKQCMVLQIIWHVHEAVQSSGS